MDKVCGVADPLNLAEWSSYQHEMGWLKGLVAIYPLKPRICVLAASGMGMVWLEA